MATLWRITLSSLASGIAAGLLLTLVQSLHVIPLIHHAELFETAAHGAASSAAHPWSPAGDVERTFFTTLANVLNGVAFALILTGCIALRAKSVDWRRGVLWGMAGFATFVAAPSLGLPPELPGSAAAELSSRQAWWFGTVVATGAGIGLIAFASQSTVKALGLAIIFIPHLIGAPHPDGVGNAPPEMAAQFAVVSLVSAAIFWGILGGLSGHIYRRLS